jgi:predicted small lipoprotein YifL
MRRTLAPLCAIALLSALAACAASSSGPLEPGTVQAHTGADIHSFVSVGAGTTR